MQRTQIYFPKELHKDLKVAAKVSNISLSEFIRKSLEEKLYRKPFRKAKSLKGKGLLSIAENAIPFKEKDLARNFDKYFEESLK